ncbi:FAD/NAD(P)-binding protein [Candidatus Methylospira mobilis]|nr:FAD/NAD(P)-binding protein [Candidatus Methylospira mobilis]
MTNPQASIAIVGAGCSGTLLAAHLLKKTTNALTVYLVERNPQQYGKGVAYSTSASCHLLNVPAGNMSAFPEDPGHFFKWAQQNEKKLLCPPWVTEIVPSAFLPRRSYGEYLCQILEEADKTAAAGMRLQRVIDEVVDVRLDSKGVELQLASGAKLLADRIVLALGNFPPGNPKVADPRFYNSMRYYGNPWLPEAYEAVLNTESCLLIGSGLTMADWCINLKRAGYAGAIHVLSRRGLWPKAHKLAPPADFSIDSDLLRPTVRNWLHTLRAYIRGSDCNWRYAMDALRPSTQRLWKTLSVVEQRRFLRHLRPY